MRNHQDTKSVILAVSMGYGHQRTAFNLKSLAGDEKFINADDYEDIPRIDKAFWRSNAKFYESVSRFKEFPLIGNYVFKFFDRFQKIEDFYPKRDLSEPNVALKENFALFHRGWGLHLIEKLRSKLVPLVSTFFTTAYMAEYFDYPGDIYCVICDTDISRTWAPLYPQKSRIKYLASTERSAERLKLYGIKHENITITGYPLPLENIGSEKHEIAKNDTLNRLTNLSKYNSSLTTYGDLIERRIGKLPKSSNHKLTITFSLGGAAVQKELAFEAIKSLKEKIKNGELKFTISAGTKPEVKKYFDQKIYDLGLEHLYDKGIRIIHEENLAEYFQRFNENLRVTDILWTKPSELSFYAGLGIPIIIAPPIGSQEVFNQDWLTALNVGIPQMDPRYADEWIFDLLKTGWFFKAAFHGYLDIEKNGYFNIKQTIQSNALALN
jgi:hypothetical protein